MATCQEILHFPDRFGGGEGGSTQAVSLTAFSQFFFYPFPKYIKYISIVLVYKFISFI